VLARLHRIVDGDHLRRVFRTGTKFHSPFFSASVLKVAVESPSRFGFIVSKQVGGAVTRNRVKRRLRSLAAHTLRDYPGGIECVVRAQAASAEAPFAELAEQWTQLVERVVAPE
jgi:ribonuclease P protein component